MITFIASYPHTATVAAMRGKILAPFLPKTRAMTYDDLFAANRFDPGTYVFTDQDRLHPAEVRLAGHFFRALAASPSCRVLNDPARVKTRHGLLRALAEAGLNDFDAYAADAVPRPRSFPVFLRIASNHSGPVSDLIHDQAELDARLDTLQAEGIPLAGLLVVEFCAERNQHGFYEKFSVLKIGNRLTLSAVLVGEQWSVKSPFMGPLPPDLMRDHVEAIRSDRHAEDLRSAFDIARIDYGRADVGLCRGRLQVYEINLNPNVTATDQYVSEEHRETRLTFRNRYGSMLREIDRPADGPEVRISLGSLDGPSGTRRRTAKATAGMLRIRRGKIGRIAQKLRRSARFLRKRRP